MHLVAVYMNWDLGVLVGQGWRGMFVVVLASQGRLLSISMYSKPGYQNHSNNMAMLTLTVQGSIHAPDVNQKADHGHVLCRLIVAEQLVTKDLARLTTSRHRVDV